MSSNVSFLSSSQSYSVQISTNKTQVIKLNLLIIVSIKAAKATKTETKVNKLKESEQKIIETLAMIFDSQLCGSKMTIFKCFILFDLKSKPEDVQFVVNWDKFRSWNQRIFDII